MSYQEKNETAVNDAAGSSLSTLEEADLWIEKNLTARGYNPRRDETQVRAFGRDFSKPLALILYLDHNGRP